MSLQLKVKSRTGRDLNTLSLPENATLKDLKTAFHKKSPKHYPSRQYFTTSLDPKDRLVLTPDVPLSNFNLSNGSVIYFKDLGPQISWRTVFLIEYFGPILIHSLFYWLPSLCYPASAFAGVKRGNEHNYTQTVAYWLVMLHYIKRELETVFIHRFSAETMPIKNIFKNSFHYWILGGAMIAYFLYHPLFTETKSHSFVTIMAVLMLICEASNLYCHIILMNLRKPGTRERGIPRGFLFEYTTCANYTAEVAAWICFSIFTQTFTSYIFLLVSFAQIAQWSKKKHVALKKEFGEKVPKRKALIPFIW